MKKRWIRIGAEIAKWFLAILIFWSVVIPYGRSLIFNKQYYSKTIYIPATKETLYLVSYSGRFWNDSGNRIELTTCDWRIFEDTDREYWYPDVYNGIADTKQTFYYKVSNDTLYISLYSAQKQPRYWDSKTKIIQIENSHFVTLEGIHGWEAVDENEQKKEWGNQGFIRFP